MKRTLRQPFLYLIAGILIMLAVVCCIIPDSEKSASVPVAILCLDDSPEGSSTVSDILAMNSIFKYYTVSSSDEMYRDIASGKADSGFIIPENYYSTSASYATLQDIRIIVTDGSTFPSLAADEIYSVIFKYSAAEILRDTIANEPLYDEYAAAGITKDAIIEETIGSYKDIMSGDGIFHIEDISGGKYNELSTVQSVEIPVKKLSGFFIFAAALLGLLNFINDKESGLFIRMTGLSQLFMEMVEVSSLMLPVSVISYICILIACPDETPLMLLVHILIYLIAVCLFTLILGLIIRKSTLMKGVLPVYLVITVIFSGIFFDLSGFSPFVKAISGLFPPYYF